MKLLVFLSIFLTFAAQSAVLTVQEISESPWTQSLDDADQVDGDEFANPNGDVFLIFSNASTDALGDATATVSAANASVELVGYGSLTKADLSVYLASEATRIVGPLPKRVYNSSGANVVISYTGVASDSISVKALRLRPQLLR